MKLSIIIPVFNEEKTIEILTRKVLEEIKKLSIEAELIIVNDASFDKTSEILERMKKNAGDFKFKLINLEKRSGKGGAIKKALSFAEGDYFLIQDADLEYNPQDYPILLEPILNNKTNVVFGSRSLKKNKRNVFWLVNKILTELFNIFFKTNLTDFSTCYKIFPASLKKDLIAIKANDFSFDVFYLTFTIAKRNILIYEVPISYEPRSYQEGKKLKIKHGFKIFFNIFKYGFFKK